MERTVNYGKDCELDIAISKAMQVDFLRPSFFAF